MADFQVHSIESAPEGAKSTLTAAKAGFGFLPNLLGVLAESPAAAEAYVTLAGLFDKTGLTPAERQVVLLTVSTINGCEYCVAAHSGLAKAARLSDADLDALRAGDPLPDAKLEALARFTRTLLAKKGWADEADLEAFYAAGYTKANVFDVILGVSFKTISNYANHVADTPLDAVFQANAWTKAA